MTTHRSPKATHPVRPVHPERPTGRGVTAALILAVLAGLAWTGGMIYAVTVGL